MEQIEKKFHDDLGKLVFEATTKIPIQRVVSELEWLKVFIEINHITDILTKPKAKADRELFDRMYG